jgi:predicted site-specific integrase-resolvase
LDFHHYKDLEVDRVEMEDRLVEIQEEIVDKEIVAQEDQMKDLDTEDQGQDLLENLLETLQEHKVEQ